MVDEYLLACGIAWRKEADPEAGSELVAALGSNDPTVRSLAYELLIEGGRDSIGLLEESLSAGVVSPEAAAPCLIALLGDQGIILGHALATSRTSMN